VRFFCLFLVLICPAAIFGLTPNFRSISELEGFESTFFSDHSGQPYMTFHYKEASTEFPKVGFLKLGISFLKVTDLNIQIDMVNASAESLLAKWHSLVSEQTIRYVTMEPISLSFFNGAEKTCNLSANKAKFTSSGELRLWDSVSFSDATETITLNGAVVIRNKSANSLEIHRFPVDGKPIVEFSFFNP